MFKTHFSGRNEIWGALLPNVPRDIGHAPRNASYLSWRVQNQIISLMGEAIQKQILSDIYQCKYFSILADEMTDVSQTEQLTLSVRFIKDTKVYE